MNVRMTGSVLVAGLFLALVGCQSGNNSGSAASPTIAPAPQPEPVAAAPVTEPTPPVVQPVAEAAPTAPDMFPVGSPVRETRTVRSEPTRTTVSKPKTVAAAKTVSTPAPKAGASKTYVVKKGDTLSGIALANKTSLTTLKKLNPSINPDKILVGQKIKLPA